MDATGWSVIIGALSLGISQAITTYFQNKRIAEVKNVATETKAVAEVAVNNQTDNTKKIAEIHEQTNGKLSELTLELKNALAKIDTLNKVASVNETTRLELAGVVERDKIRADRGNKEVEIAHQPIQVEQVK